MSRQRLLVVEDNLGMRGFYDKLLSQVSRNIPLDYFLAKNAPEARRILKDQIVDIVILDWVMPGTDGLQFLKELRADPMHRDLLIIMVSSKSSAQDCAEALDAGADDYLSKPFPVEVLLARLRSLARRQERAWQSPAPVACAGIRLDPSTGTVTSGGKPLHLHPKEMLLLEVFLRRPDVLHPPQELWDRVWGCESENWEHLLVATLSNLKKNLGPKKGEHLQCRRGLGYIFTA